MHKTAKRYLALIISMVLATGILTGCGSQHVNADKKYKSDSFAMGTVISQEVYGPSGQKAIDEVNRKIATLESRTTFNAQEGDVYKINQNAGKGKVTIDPETVKVIQKSLQVAELSGGAFDITVGPLVQSWAIGTNQERVLSAEEVNKLLPLVNYKDVEVDDHSAGLKRAGQEIDLGGIEKGYAGDVAIQIYQKNGIRSAFINLGGNVVTLGSKPDGTPWTVGVRNPRPSEGQGDSGQIVGYLEAENKAVTTAGDDQRYFIQDGQRYCHIIDPHTGYPAKSGLMSVTVVADSSFDADAVDTALFVLGLDKGRAFIQQYGQQFGHMEAIFITTDKKIYVTAGLKGKFHFQDDSHEYQYIP